MEKKTISLDEFIQLSRETLDSYYRTRSAEDFFMIDGMLQVCKKQNLTKDMVPTLIEMTNVIVMG